MAAEPVEPPITLSAAASAAMEEYNSAKVTLADYCAKATAKYAQKNFEEAAELYSQASEMQVELNGEMSPENAEILFLYGRALFKVGQKQSDILNGGAGEKKKKKTKKANGAPISKKEAVKSEENGELEAVAEADEGEKVIEKVVASEENELEPKKALFTFTGDENFDDSEEDEAENDEDEEEEDDMASAFEILDLARVLFLKKLEQPEDGEDKGKDAGDSPMARHIKERLADTHHLLGEISMENEKFDAAISDLRNALEMKLSLYPEDSGINSGIRCEAHYMLSLALEFGSVKSGDSEEQVDQEMRDAAVKEMQAAIDIQKTKLQNKEVELASSSSPDDNDVTRAEIVEGKELIADMEARLVELSKPPVDVGALKAAVFGPSMGGLQNTTSGESAEEVIARVEDAKKNANDLSGLVRHKPKAAAEPEVSNGTNGNGKRKAEDEPEVETKKAKVEDVPEEA